MDVTIRKLENNLITLGTGVIVFGFWSFIKFILTAVATGSQMWEDIDEGSKTTVIIATWIFVILYALVYLWVGMSARAEGNGKHKRIFYLIVIGTIAAFSIIIIAVEILGIIYLNTSIGTMIITLIIDATRMVFLIELLCSAIKLRKLKKLKSKELEKEGEAA